LYRPEHQKFPRAEPAQLFGVLSEFGKGLARDDQKRDQTLTPLGLLYLLLTKQGRQKPCFTMIFPTVKVTKHRGMEHAPSFRLLTTFQDWTATSVLFQDWTLLPSLIT
jgi:hypothetical protein